MKNAFLRREFVFAVLNDDEGINTEAFEAMFEYLAEADKDLAMEINSSVKCTNERWYIREEHD